MFYFEINWFNCSHFQLHSFIFLFSVLPPSVKLSLSAHTQGSVPNMTILGVFTLIDIQIHDGKIITLNEHLEHLKLESVAQGDYLDIHIIISLFETLVFLFLAISLSKKEKEKRKTSRLGINIYTYTAVILKFQFQSEFDTKSITVT